MTTALKKKTRPRTAGFKTFQLFLSKGVLPHFSVKADGIMFRRN
jgi:hypothetical protein